MSDPAEPGGGLSAPAVAVDSAAILFPDAWEGTVDVCFDGHRVWSFSPDGNDAGPMRVGARPGGRERSTPTCTERPNSACATTSRRRTTPSCGALRRCGRAGRVQGLVGPPARPRQVGQPGPDVRPQGGELRDRSFWRTWTSSSESCTRRSAYPPTWPTGRSRRDPDRQVHPARHGWGHPYVSLGRDSGQDRRWRRSGSSTPFVASAGARTGTRLASCRCGAPAGPSSTSSRRSWRSLRDRPLGTRPGRNRRAAVRRGRGPLVSSARRPREDPGADPAPVGADPSFKLAAAGDDRGRLGEHRGSPGAFLPRDVAVPPTEAAGTNLCTLDQPS